MGKLVTFWSPIAGQAKVTSVLCAVAAMLGVKYPNVRIALAGIGESRDLEERLEGRIGWGRKKELYDRSGLNALMLQYKQGELSADKIKRCGIPLLLPGLYLYPGAGKEERSPADTETDLLRRHILTKKLTAEYDMVFLDLQEKEEQEVLRCLEASDVVVVVLTQNPRDWEAFYTDWCGKLAGKKVCIVIGGYLSSSRYSLRQLAKYAVHTEEYRKIYAVPLNTGFMDAMSEGRTLEFFLKNEHVRKKEENYEFMEQTEKTAVGIAGQAVFLSGAV